MKNVVLTIVLVSLLFFSTLSTAQESGTYVGAELVDETELLPPRMTVGATAQVFRLGFKTGNSSVDLLAAGAGGAIFLNLIREPGHVLLGLQVPIFLSGRLSGEDFFSLSSGINVAVIDNFITMGVGYDLFSLEGGKCLGLFCGPADNGDAFTKRSLFFMVNVNVNVGAKSGENAIKIKSLNTLAY